MRCTATLRHQRCGYHTRGGFFWIHAKVRSGQKNQLRMELQRPDPLVGGPSSFVAAETSIRGVGIIFTGKMTEHDADSVNGHFQRKGSSRYSGNLEYSWGTHPN